MNAKDVLMTAGYFAILVMAYVFRYAMEENAFNLLFIGLLLIGGVVFSRKLLSIKKITSDERTQSISGQAARISMIALFAFATLAIAYLSITHRPTSPVGVLAVLLGVMSITYAATFYYLEHK